MGWQRRFNEVNMGDGSPEGEEGWQFYKYIPLCLQGRLWGRDFQGDRDAVIISDWWD